MRTRILAPAGALALIVATLPAITATAAADPATGSPPPAAAPAGTYAACPAPKHDGVMECMSVIRAQPVTPKGVQVATPAGYSPADLRAAYNLPASDAAPTVAIVDAYHDPHAEADLAVYRAQYGLPPCTAASGCFTQVDQRGGTQWAADDPGWAGEIALDLDMVSGICPGCRLLLVEADTATDTALFAAEDEAVALGARFISNSWGGDETTDEAQDDVHFDHPGIVIAAATGDQGFPGSYPAASPYVTAVGGTTLTRDPSTARGWTESAWRLAGSTCSAWEPAPAFQSEAMTDCTTRATADVAAVADPATGVAVYDGGWQVFGGTSVATPIITAAYALAGPPLTGAQPNTIPYQHPGALNDVTTGGGDWCSFKFCTGGPGWDGPTGLGTPNGLAAFSPGAHGTLTGTVTDSATHQPIAGATVSAGGGQQVSTGPHGEYTLTLPPGSYTVSAGPFGYQQASVPVTLADGQARTVNLRLRPRPRATVSGTVRDGSGHGWPVYASVQVHGEPSTRTFTDPVTGTYQLSLPQHDSYDLDVHPVYAGYRSLTETVAVGDTAVRDDLRDPVDFASCTAAAGYHYTSRPVYTQTFDGSTAPPGWTTENAYGRPLLWSFDDPGGRGNLSGGSGGFAIVDSDYANLSSYQDTSLASPAWDLSGLTHPTLTFHSDLYSAYARAAVEVSSDGGQTWSQLWVHSSGSVRGPDLETLDLTPWAGQPAVQVRFRYQSYPEWWWEVDDVTVAERSCTPQPGGLVVGQVRDANTGSGLTGATVTGGPISTTTIGTPADPALGEGLYWAFAAPGSYSLAASQPGGYQVVSRSVDVTDDAVTAADFTLPAGRIATSISSLTANVGLGASGTSSVTVTNTGTAPVQFGMHEVPGGATPMSVTSQTPTQQIKGSFRAGPGDTTIADTMTASGRTISPAAAPWVTVADYPIPIADNAMATDRGTVYSVGGLTNNGAVLARAYRYDPDTAAWTRLPDMQGSRDYPQAAFLDGKLYVAGGFDQDDAIDPSMEIYDPATGSWSAGPAMPTGVAAAGVAVLDDRMYVVGGCDAADSCGIDTVQVFDPVTSRWETAATYPAPVNLEGCGAVSGRLYCAGGTSDQYGPSRDGWAYDPDTDHWTQIAGMPYGYQFAAAYAAADGRLLMVGGVLANNIGEEYLTNQGWAYDPATNTWSSLPNSNTITWRSAGACGFYKVGGAGYAPAPTSAALLPGYGDCAAADDVSWLSFAPSGMQTLQPGASVTFTVTLDTTGLTQPGIYQAGLSLSEDTPYPYQTIPVTMTVAPPSSWGKLAGTVTGTTCTGATVPIRGATIGVTGAKQTFTLTTAADGSYQLWLDAKNSPLDLVVSKDGWTPTGSSGVRLTKGKTRTVDFDLAPDPPC